MTSAPARRAAAGLAAGLLLSGCTLFELSRVRRFEEAGARYGRTW